MGGSQHFGCWRGSTRRLFRRHPRSARHRFAIVSPLPICARTSRADVHWVSAGWSRSSPVTSIQKPRICRARSPRHRPLREWSGVPAPNCVISVSASALLQEPDPKVNSSVSACPPPGAQFTAGFGTGWSGSCSLHYPHVPRAAVRKRRADRRDMFGLHLAHGLPAPCSSHLYRRWWRGRRD